MGLMGLGVRSTKIKNHEKKSKQTNIESSLVTWWQCHGLLSSIHPSIQPIYFGCLSGTHIPQAHRQNQKMKFRTCDKAEIVHIPFLRFLRFHLWMIGVILSASHGPSNENEGGQPARKVLPAWIHHHHATPPHRRSHRAPLRTALRLVLVHKHI